MAILVRRLEMISCLALTAEQKKCLRMQHIFPCYSQMIGTGGELELCLTQRVKSKVRSGGNLPKSFCNLWFSGARIMQ